LNTLTALSIWFM